MNPQISREEAEVVVLMGQAAEHFASAAVQLRDVGASYAMGAMVQAASDAAALARTLLLAEETSAADGQAE